MKTMIIAFLLAGVPLAFAQNQVSKKNTPTINLELKQKKPLNEIESPSKSMDFGIKNWKENNRSKFSPNLEKYRILSSGSEGVGGGDEIALDFIRTAVSAIQEMKIIASEKAKLLTLVKETKFYVTDQQLPVIIPVSSAKSQFQYSTAVNDPSSNSVYIQRTRWIQIKSEELRKELARHEILSLAGQEKTGRYNLSSSVANSSDVIVPSPNFDTSVTLNGTPGDLQSKEYRVYKIQFDSMGQYLVNSINDILGRDLGEATPVEQGRYGIWFSGMYLLTSVKQGENFQYTTKSVQLPLANGITSFRILRDFSNVIEQEKFIVALWLQNDIEGCKTPSEAIAKFCDLKVKNDFKSFKLYITSTVLASSCGVDPICKSNFTAIRSTILAKGDANHDRVAMLPGAYIAEFTNKYGDVLKQNFIVSQ